MHYPLEFKNHTNYVVKGIWQNNTIKCGSSKQSWHLFFSLLCLPISKHECASTNNEKWSHWFWNHHSCNYDHWTYNGADWFQSSPRWSYLQLLQHGLASFNLTEIYNIQFLMRYPLWWFGCKLVLEVIFEVLVYPRSIVETMFEPIATSASTPSTSAKSLWTRSYESSMTWKMDLFQVFPERWEIVIVQANFYGKTKTLKVNHQ